MSGQSCCASSRIFVHENVHDKYVKYLKEIADSKVVGDPFDENTTNGAIISKVQFEKILDYVESGKKQGAKVVSGGNKCASKGYFMRPTVFVDVTDDMKIAQEEVIYSYLNLFKKIQISIK
jgi:aldehyde dehydrogenase (NAD+)